MRCHVLAILFVASIMVVMAKRRKTSWTTANPGLNLQGKMFTLSKRGAVTLYAPSSPPSPSYPWTTPPPYSSPSYPWTTPPPYSSPSYPWTTPPSYSSPYYPWTTTPPYSSPSYPWTSQSPAKGVSVCLRYVAESFDSQSIFILSPSSPSRLALQGRLIGPSDLSFSDRSYYTVSFRSYRFLWSVVPRIWTSLCVTVDTLRGVAQLFRDGSMSVRKTLPLKEYKWSGPPVLQVSGFEGQVTDVEVWDYPVSYSQVQSYISYTTYQGSVLTWSRIGYSLAGDALLEDDFKRQAGQPVKKLYREPGPIGEKRRKKPTKDGRKERRRKLFRERVRDRVTERDGETALEREREREREREADRDWGVLNGITEIQ